MPIFFNHNASHHHLFWHPCLTFCGLFWLIFIQFNFSYSWRHGQKLGEKPRMKNEWWVTFLLMKAQCGMMSAELLLAVESWCSKLLCLCHAYWIRRPPARTDGFPVFVAALMWRCKEFHCGQWTVKSCYETFRQINERLNRKHCRVCYDMGVIAIHTEFLTLCITAVLYKLCNNVLQSFLCHPPDAACFTLHVAHLSLFFCCGFWFPSKSK